MQYHSLVTAVPQTWGLRANLGDPLLDFRRSIPDHSSLSISGATMGRVKSTKFLGVHISENLSCTNITSSLAWPREPSSWKRCSSLHTSSHPSTRHHQMRSDQLHGNCHTTNLYKGLTLEQICRICSPPGASKRPPALWLTPTTPSLDCSQISHLGTGPHSLNADCAIVSSPNWYVSRTPWYPHSHCSDCKFRLTIFWIFLSLCMRHFM